MSRREDAVDAIHPWVEYDVTPEDIDAVLWGIMMSMDRHEITQLFDEMRRDHAEGMEL